jgi:hypothetical protein
MKGLPAPGATRSRRAFLFKVVTKTAGQAVLRPESSARPRWARQA